MKDKHTHKNKRTHKNKHTHKNKRTHKNKLTHKNKHTQDYNNSKTFKKQTCGPFKEHPYTCYTTESLIKIKDKWNKKHPHHNTKINSDEPHIIWKKLKKLLFNVCDNEKCWLRREFMKHYLDQNLLSYTFAPDRPDTWETNNNTWLNSNNILSVMKQYEKKYKFFRFIGPSPIDYNKIVNGDCVWNELCKFDLSQYLKKGVNKIGIIFNTDPHDKDGEHWIATFIDINSKEPYIFYFDSTGDKISSNINKFIKNVISQAKSININLKYIDNHKIVHQKGTTECGMYCLYFIIQLLTDSKDYSYFLDKNNKIPDDFVEKYRHIYFN